MNWMELLGVIGGAGGILTAIIVPLVTSSTKRKETRLQAELARQEAQQRVDLEMQSKEFDAKLSMVREEGKNLYSEAKNKLSQVYSLLYGYMWKLLISTDADRVFIIQPHPFSNKQFISISLEVVHPDRDVTSQKDAFQSRKMSEWAGLISELSCEDLIIYENLHVIKDHKTAMEARRRGTNVVVFKQLRTDEGEWKGSLGVEYTHKKCNEVDFDNLKEHVALKGLLIADILPEYQPDPRDA